MGTPLNEPKISKPLILKVFDEENLTCILSNFLEPVVLSFFSQVETNQSKTIAGFYPT